MSSTPPIGASQNPSGPTIKTNTRTFRKEDWDTLLQKMKGLDDLSRLNLSPCCDDAVIKKSYRKLSLKFHPDKNKKFRDEATQAFQMIKESSDRLLALPKTQRVNNVFSFDNEGSSNVDRDAFFQRKQQEYVNVLRHFDAMWQRMEASRIDFDEKKEASFKQFEEDQIEITKKDKAELTAKKAQRMSKLESIRDAQRKRHQEEMDAFEEKRASTMDHLHQQHKDLDMKYAQDGQNREEELAIRTLIVARLDYITTVFEKSDDKIPKILSMRLAKLENECRVKKIDFSVFLKKLQQYFLEKEVLIKADMDTLNAILEERLDRE
ncbi:MAG: J domain-containing protein [Candidatus Margulisbacteria bacterium]|nr:J domain-containing protein [Candidatus Margulisiibacteriota bacterium]